MKLLKIQRLINLLGLSLLITLPVLSHGQEASAKIAYVSLERILNESKIAKEAQSKMQNEFGQREKEVRDGIAKIKTEAAQLDKDAAILPEADRIRKQRELADHDRELQRKQRELIEDSQRRGAEERAKIFERANQVLKSIVEQKKLDLVVQDAAYVNPRIDITNDVLSALNK
ncbi:OmpH family outer membrane protein [Polynucleobacter kasalickyi]|uniref:Periplasmic chaperone for outer membrane proteins Skp n=1 Tax=Polynucleobacter kasalickyi TaxID=1938817 RepID=A0A1W1ZDI7_9BURK|nr:OmpH family outer membrane protein [Polynucleobacter kasalickyi]SMC46098.1 periplasmic chaperone for outer membrane proteins Skp [Polynucleobacter kasalickyi]